MRRQANFPRALMIAERFFGSRAYGVLYHIWLALLTVKVAIVIALLACILFVKLVIGSADAAPSKSKNATAKDRAYTLTLMCATFASDGDNDRDILRTMDAVRKLGKAKGYDDKRLANDLGTMASVVGDRLRTEPDYIDKNREICRKLQLIE